MRRLSVGFLVGCLILTGALRPEAAAAHPHVFIENTLELVFDASGLAGIRVKWEFDSLASSQYITDLDPNGDGTLTAAEWKAERDDIAGFLSKEHFFIYAMVNGKKTVIPAIQEFVATYADGVLVYSFFAPLAVPRGKANVLISVYDPSYYSDFQTVEDNVRLTGKPGDAHVALADAPELAFYNGQVIPIGVRLQF